LELQTLILFISLALLAEILGTVGGFGSSLFFVPIASFFFDFYSVLGITALFHVTSNISKIIFFRGGVHKKLILSIGIPAVVFVIVGAFLSKFADQKTLEFTLSIFLITISVLLLLFRNYTIKPNTLNSFAGGSLSGLLAGLLGTGGAIRGITFAAFNLDKVTFIATSAIIDLGIDASRSVVYVYNGYVHKQDLYIIAILFVVSLIGTLLGKKILTYISQVKFRQTVLFLILIVGILTLAKIIFNIGNLPL
jgi:uncharacterized membrane protein YfcA